MKLSTVPLNDDDDTSEHVTIEFHSIPLTDSSAPVASNDVATKPEVIDHFSSFCNAISWVWRVVCCCRRGVEFEPLTSTEGR